MSATVIKEVIIPYPEPKYGEETHKEYHDRVHASGFSFRSLTQKHQAIYCKGGCGSDDEKNALIKK